MLLFVSPLTILFVTVLLLLVDMFDNDMRTFVTMVHGQQLYHLHGESANCPFNTMCTCQWGDTSILDGGGGSVSGGGNIDGGSYLHDIACLSVPFTKLPNLPQGRIGQVDIADSGLEAVHAEPLSASKIESLRLMNNDIKHIDDKAFSTMAKSLASLDLAYNKLDSIPFNAFRDLQNLQWLNIVGNQIRSLEGDWSYMQNTLTSLLVSENDITSLPRTDSDTQQELSTCIRDLQVLSTLNIDGNKIIHIEGSSLPKSLQTLGLSNNLLTEFPTHVVNTLPRLQWIDVRTNQISELPNFTFRPHRQMEKVDFGENHIKILPKYTFNNSMQIRDFILDFNLIEKIPNEAFLSINCGRLILGFNHITQIQSKAFHGIDNSLEYLDLEHNRLTTIPVQAFSRLNILKYLYLSSNYLRELPDNSFHTFAQSLRVLSLSGNLLTHIPSNALQNCTKLSYLNLGYNQILEINEMDLGEWAYNLNTLLIRSNRITELDGNIFNNTKNLRELSFSFNPLNYLNPNIFRDVAETLETLELSFALADERFPIELLKPLTNLLWLATDNNNIEILQRNAFDTFPQLQYLTLESNQLMHLPANTFKWDIHTQLRDLRLSNNRLEVLETNSFKSLPNLQSVLLGGNRIQTIKTRAFHNCTNLMKIVLADNRIKNVQHEAFSNLPKLKKLDLQQNNMFSFSLNSLANSTSREHPLNVNLSNNEIFEILPPKDILHVQSLDLDHNNLQIPPKYSLEKITNSLRKLYLSYNRIEMLELEAFGMLEELEILTLKSNLIQNIKKHAFLGLESLQILDLSCNSIKNLHSGQFSLLQRLRMLDLSHNRLRYLPKDTFQNTKLERLKLSDNEFTTIPSTVLSQIKRTLSDLAINNNNIEHIDSTMFLSTPHLLNLDLSQNRLNLLPDNVFTSLGSLQKLDLSYNPLRANYKELFHYAQSLKYLNLAHIGMSELPTLPLPNLVYLNVSSNQLEDIPKYSLRGLSELRTLNLKHNNLKQIPSHIWTFLPALKQLEISYNPIKEITSKCFYGLTELQNLEMHNLEHLTHIDADALSHMPHLSSLSIRLNNKIQLRKILSNITSIQTLSLEVMAPHLGADQFHGVLTSRIKHLEMWGTQLRTLDRDIFIGLENNAELLIKIHHTQIEELPSGLIVSLHRVPHLRLDLRHNQLTSLTPDVFYTNITTWENLGTKLIAGGLLLNDNPWVCDCRLIWLGHWLRRWLVESLQIHAMDPDSAQRAHARIRRVQCTHPDSNVITAVVDLRPEHMSCQASALSTTSSPTHQHLVHQQILLLLSLCTIYLYNIIVCYNSYMNHCIINIIRTVFNNHIIGRLINTKLYKHNTISD